MARQVHVLGLLLAVSIVANIYLYKQHMACLSVLRVCRENMIVQLDCSPLDLAHSFGFDSMTSHSCFDFFSDKPKYVVKNPAYFSVCFAHFWVRIHDQLDAKLQGYIVSYS